jgi:hypothetical protein
MTTKNRYKQTLQNHARTPRDEHEPAPARLDEARTVMIVEVRPNGERVVIETFNTAGYSEARAAAERAQALADAQGLPRRAFICDKFGVPVFAAGMSLKARDRALAVQAVIVASRRREE